MTLRWRHYLAVVSLVLGLGIASSAVLVHLVRSETAWGMQQRAEGSAMSVAEFLPLLESAPDDRREAMLTDVIARLGAASLQVQRWPLDASPPTMARAAVGMQAPPPPSSEVLDTLAGEGAAWFADDEADQTLIHGYALAYDGDGEPIALVSVSEQDDSLSAALQSLRGKLIAVAVVMFLVACVVAEWLTRMVQGELNTLCAVADELELGRNPEEWEPGRIQEINDLGGTLQTMGSLLDDGVQRTRLRFFKAETIPTRHDMARHVITRHWSALLRRATPSGAAWRRLGEPPPEHFLDWRSDASGWSVAVGTLAEKVPMADTLETALMAQALASRILHAGGDDTEARRSDPLLQHVRFDWARRDKSGFDTCSVRPEDARDAPQAEARCGNRALFGTLDESGMHIARMYVAQSADRPLDRVIAELESLLGERYCGFLWLCDVEVGS